MKLYNTSKTILFLIFSLGLNGFRLFHWLFWVESAMCLKSINQRPALNVNHGRVHYIDDQQ